MSEGVTITRLSKAAREFNIGMKTEVDFLIKKGFPIEMDPNAKLTASNGERVGIEMGHYCDSCFGKFKKPMRGIDGMLMRKDVPPLK